MKVTNYLLGYENMYIIQDPDMFNFSLDSVLLPNFVKLDKKVKNIMDIGCGNGPVPLILSTKTEAHIVGVEIQKDVYDMAVESVNINKLENQIDIINNDIKDIYKEFEVGSFDMITCNPPYFKYKEYSNINKNDYKTIARHEVYLNLEDLMTVSKYLLKNNGSLNIVHRPERLTDIVSTMRKYGIEPKRVQFVYPHPGSNANILLIEGIKMGKPGLKILPCMYSHTSDGEYTEEIKKYFVNN
jgi:tRNA1(Val) A37 N6-methylase TrmN6